MPPLRRVHSHRVYESAPISLLSASLAWRFSSFPLVAGDLPTTQPPLLQRSSLRPSPRTLVSDGALWVSASQSPCVLSLCPSNEGKDSTPIITMSHAILIITMRGDLHSGGPLSYPVKPQDWCSRGASFVGDGRDFHQRPQLGPWEGFYSHASQIAEERPAAND